MLINSILTSLPMFMLFFFRIPKGVLKKLDYYRSRFFFGKVMVTKRNTGWQDGAFCAVLGVLEVWE